MPQQPSLRVVSVTIVAMVLSGAHTGTLSAQGRTWQVSTEPQLQAAMRQMASNTTIVLAPGTYRLTNTLYFNGAFSNVVIRGATANRDDVILQGPGMRNANYGNVPFGIWTGGGVHGITIANLTIRDFYFHAVIFNAGTERPHVANVRLADVGEQFIKGNPSGATGVNDGIVELSVIEYTGEARDTYTNGVDVHAGHNWIIRGNLFRNITSSAGLAGPAVLMWNGAAHTLTERNLFVNCARGIHYGLVDRPGVDHSGGVIRNNIFFRSATQPGDVGIGVFDSPGTQVLNNTVFVSGTYATPIEYRFAGASGVELTNNLLDGVVARRDGASGTERNTLARATAGLFRNAATGDLHLAPGSAAIDRGLNLSAVSNDWDGDTRPQGLSTDIGADEHNSGCAGPPPPPSNLVGRITSGVGTATWNPSPGAASYIVQAGWSLGASDLFNANVGAATAVSAAGLPPGFRAFVRVIAVSACGQLSPPTPDVLVQ